MKLTKKDTFFRQISRKSLILTSIRLKFISKKCTRNLLILTSFTKSTINQSFLNNIFYNSLILTNIRNYLKFK